MTRLVSIDGAIHRPEDARISAYDRGFLYGDSVFETVRTYAGEPFALDEHLARLERSAERVGIVMPITLAAFAMEIRKAVRAAKNPESSARAMLTRGSGPLGLDPSNAEAPLRVIYVEPLATPPVSAYRDGVAVVTIHTVRASDAAHGAKVGNYFASLLALREAKAAGAHEALITNGAGHVAEGTTSNVFLVRGGALVTPPEEAGILLGITRAHVIELARERHIEVRVEPVTKADLASAEEVFLTSTIREILPVVRVDEARIAGGAPGRITRALHEAFRARVGLGAAPMPWE